MSIPVSLRVLAKPVLCALPSAVSPVNVAIARPVIPLNLLELSRLLKRSSVLLDCCRSEFGEEEVTNILTVDVIEALPHILEILQEFVFETNAALEGNPVTYIDWQTDQGSD